MAHPLKAKFYQATCRVVEKLKQAPVFGYPVQIAVAIWRAPTTLRSLAALQDKTAKLEKSVREQNENNLWFVRTLCTVIEASAGNHPYRSQEISEQSQSSHSGLQAPTGDARRENP